MTFDLAPTVLALLGVEHNFTFPLGENLLEPANPERLKRERAHAEAIRSYTLLNSDLVLDRRPEISVRTSPVHMLNIGGVSVSALPPAAGRAGASRQGALSGPAALSIPPDCGGDLVQRRRLDRRDKPRNKGFGSIYRIRANPPDRPGRLPGAAGKKTWILGFGKQGKWICSTGDEVEALKVTGDLTLNRE